MSAAGDRGRETRERIIAAATEKFAEKGFGEATIAEIAQLAGISEGAIYRHFASKDEILLHCLTPVFDQIARMAAESMPLRCGMSEAELWEEVRKGIRGRLDMFARYHEEFKILFGELPHSAEVAQMYFDALDEQREDLKSAHRWLRREEVVRRPPPRSAFLILLGQVMGMWGIQSMLRLLQDENLRSPAGLRVIPGEHLVDDMTDFLMYGMAGASGEELGVTDGAGDE